MRFHRRPVAFGKLPQDLRNAAALPRASKSESTFNRCGFRHQVLLIAVSGRCERPLSPVADVRPTWNESDMLPLLFMVVAAAQPPHAPVPIAPQAGREVRGSADSPATEAKNKLLIEAYLLKRRQILMEQIRYAVNHNSRLEEVAANGERTDVSADWLDRVQSEYAEVTQLLIDSGLLTQAEARADASR